MASFSLSPPRNNHVDAAGTSVTARTKAAASVSHGGECDALAKNELEEAAGLAKDFHASLQGSPQAEHNDDVPLRVVRSPASGSGSPRLEIDVEHDSVGSRQGSPSP